MTLFTPPSGVGAAIVLVHEIFGVTPYMLQRAQQLHDAGYTVGVPHLFHRQRHQVVRDDDPEALEKGMGLMAATDWDTAVAQVQDAVGHLRRMPGTGRRVALLGFCYGGGLAYAAAATARDGETPDAVVSYYGSALPQLVDSVPVPPRPQLHHFGTNDDFVSHDQVRHIRAVVECGPDTTFCTWEGAGHAFDNPSPDFLDADASAAAWQVTLEWLALHHPASVANP